MNKVVFVGDEPSAKNMNKNLPFVGAKCFNTLISWIAVISPNYYICLNSHTENDLQLIQELQAKQQFKVVVLGKKAQARLQKISIPCFLLPHPSPANLQTNDKEFISQQLKSCREWINDEILCNYPFAR